MKFLIFSLVLIFGRAYASDCSIDSRAFIVSEKRELTTDMPKFMEGATITVTLKDGSSTQVPAERFKVVPRKQQFLVSKVTENVARTCVNRHRVGLVAGKGAKVGLDRDNSQAPNLVSVESRAGAVGGLSYQYLTDVKVLKMPLYLGVQGQTNETGLIMGGVEF